MRHALTRLALVTVCLSVPAAPSLADPPTRIVVDQGEEDVELTLGQLVDAKGKGRKFRGAGLLHLDGREPLSVTVLRKVNAKKGRAKYLVKTRRGAPVKLVAKFTTDLDPEQPLKANVLFKADGVKTRVKDLDAVQFLGLDDPLPGGDVESAGLAIDVNGNDEDGLLAVVENRVGTTVAFYGTTDSEGDVETLDSAIVTDADGNDTELVFDALGRPLQTLAHNGVVFDWLWYSDRHVRITVTDPTGLVALSIDVDPVTLEEPVGEDTEFVPPDLPDDPAKAPGTRGAAKTSDQQVRLSVLRGGSPADPAPAPAWVGGRNITIRLSSSAGPAYNRSYNARRVGLGEYEATIIVEGESRTQVAINRVIKGLAGAHDFSCAAVSGVHPGLFTFICTALGAGVSVIPGVQVAAGVITTACGGAFLAYRGYCDVFKNGGAVGASFDLEAYLKDRLRSVIDTRSSGATVFVRGYVREWNEFTNSLGAPRGGNTVRARINKSGTLRLGGARLSVNVAGSPVEGPGDSVDDGESKVDTAPAGPSIVLTMTPARPSVGTSYTARAAFAGIPEGGRARIALRPRSGADSQSAQVTYEQAGSDGTHVLTSTRTLGAVNAHNAYAQIFDAGGTVVAIRQLDY